MADDLEKEVLKIQRDAALNEADDTALERDIALTQEARLAHERNIIAGQRDAAFTRASVEQDSAAKSATAFYVLLAVAVLAAIVIAAVYFNRPGPQAGVTVLQPVGPAPTSDAPVILHREAPVAPAASTPTSAMPAPRVMTRPTAPPPPVIVNMPPQTVIVNTPPASPAPTNSAPAPAAPSAEGAGGGTTPSPDSGANAGGGNAGGAEGTGAVTSTAPAAPTTSATPPSGQ